MKNVIKTMIVIVLMMMMACSGDEGIQDPYAICDHCQDLHDDLRACMGEERLATCMIFSLDDERYLTCATGCEEEWQLRYDTCRHPDVADELWELCVYERYASNEEMAPCVIYTHRACCTDGSPYGVTLVSRTTPF